MNFRSSKIDRKIRPFAVRLWCPASASINQFSLNYLETDQSVADELFSMNHSSFELRVSEGWRQLVHRKSRTIIFENSHPFPRKSRVSDGTEMVEKVVSVDQWYLTIKHVYNC